MNVVLLLICISQVIIALIYFASGAVLCGNQLLKKITAINWLGIGIIIFSKICYIAIDYCKLYVYYTKYIGLSPNDILNSHFSPFNLLSLISNFISILFIIALLAAALPKSSKIVPCIFLAFALFLRLVISIIGTFRDLSIGAGIKHIIQYLLTSSLGVIACLISILLLLLFAILKLVKPQLNLPSFIGLIPFAINLITSVVHTFNLLFSGAFFYDISTILGNTASVITVFSSSLIYLFVGITLVRKENKISVPPTPMAPENDINEYCGECGAVLEKDSQFCTKCGTNISENVKEVYTSDAAPLPQNETEVKTDIINSTIVQTSVADEIAKFKALLDSGAITQEEYEIKKKQLLNL